MEKYWFFLTFVTKNAYYLNKIKTTSEKNVTYMTQKPIMAHPKTGA